MKALVLVALARRRLENVALVLLALAGCAAQSIDDIDIACTSDDQCPSGAWCDLRFKDDVCRSLDHSGPPHIAFDGFEVGGGLQPTITVPPGTTSIDTFELRNDGGSQTDVVVTVIGPACLDAGSLTRPDGDLLDMGATLEAEFDVDPAAGCGSPDTLTITATADSRAFTFTAQLSISP